jgi:hypothetical protein
MGGPASSYATADTALRILMDTGWLIKVKSVKHRKGFLEKNCKNIQNIKSKK